MRVLGEGTREVIKPVFKIAILESFKENFGLCMAASCLGSLRSESLEDFSPFFFSSIFSFYFSSSWPPCPNPHPRGHCPVLGGRNLSAGKVGEVMAPLAGGDTAGLASSVTNC